jgi:F0F1-type ATP synthase delta subunit
MEIAEEDGRLPLKRGPKALQEKGIPYYHLTKKGILVGLAINGVENMSSQLKEFFTKCEPEEKKIEKILTKFMTNSPNFTYSIFQKYVKAFCENKINELLPFDLSKLKDISDENLVIQKEIVLAFLKLTNQEKKEAAGFLEKIT